MVKTRHPVTPAVRQLRAAGVALTHHLYDYEPGGGATQGARALGVDPHRVIKPLIMEDNPAIPPSPAATAAIRWAAPRPSAPARPCSCIWLLTQAEGTLDIEERKVIMAEIEKIMQQDGPITQPVWRSIVTGMNNKVKNYTMHPQRWFYGHELAIES